MSSTYIYEVKDIMEILNISRNTTYKLIKSGEIPYRIIGNRYKVPSSAFHRWLNNLPKTNKDGIILPVINDEQTLLINERSTL